MGPLCLDAVASVRSLVERYWDDSCRRGLAADADFDVRADSARLRRDVGHADIFLQERRGAPAGDAARFLAADPHGVAVASNALIEHFKADELARNAGFFLARKHVAAEKGGLFHLTDPAQPGFPGRGGVVNFMAVEAHAGLQAKRVARAEAAGNHFG